MIGTGMQPRRKWHDTFLGALLLWIGFMFFTVFAGIIAG